MALYDGFFDAVPDGVHEDGTTKYDREYDAGDFTTYFGQIVGSGVCIYRNEDSYRVRMGDGGAIVSPGYLFINGYWLKSDADYTVQLTGTGIQAIVAHLNTGAKRIDLEVRSAAQSYPDSLVLALVDTASGTVEDTRYNADICGVIDAAGSVSSKIEWALNYIDTEIEAKLAQAEADIQAQSRELDAKIAEVQAQVDKIEPPPIGSIKFSASQDVGPEWLRCDGSFINERDYPELVAELGKLIPSGDKFQLLSDGEIAPQITNGVLYGGRLWVYSYSTKKLYGIDVEGTAATKEIAVTSEDTKFNEFVQPTVQRPLALSIVPMTAEARVQVFLSQIILDQNNISTSGVDASLRIFAADFSDTADTITMESAINSYAGSTNGIKVEALSSIPYVVSVPGNGMDWFYCVISAGNNSGTIPGYYVKFGMDRSASIHTMGTTYSQNISVSGQRLAYSKKNMGEAVLLTNISNAKIISSPNGLFSLTKSSGNIPSGGLTIPHAINVMGTKRLLSDLSLSNVLSTLTDTARTFLVPVGLTYPSAARTFIDAAAYLWGKDIYLIFVGTGIIFSRTLEEGSFGYLDTTSVLGTITQFGYLDYSQDEGTLYLLGQDTTNKVKVAKIVLNTLYDYANDGAWLPMIASDGVPAYIKAKEEA